MDTLTFWNDIGSTKSFEDPFFFERVEPFLSFDSSIVEYGCGYGRLLQEFSARGYKAVSGYDFAPKMVERGRKQGCEIHLTESGVIPLPDESTDLVILSTVLCCISDKGEQKRVFDEIFRVLKPEGVVYVTDFLVSSHYLEKYRLGRDQGYDWGVYTTSEGALVRHYTIERIMELLAPFELVWFEQFRFKTMNNNPVKTFHLIAQKSLSEM